ncbi:MAG TPA: IniB N-terminal domain-containing protein [Pseudonocardiaceae bacterium]
MSSTKSLLDFILSLLNDSDAREAFHANPDQALADAGLSDVCGEDVSDAMTYVAEYHPVSTVGNREYNVGNRGDDRDYGDDRSYQHDGGRHHEGWRPDPGLDSHAAVVQQLEYISNNYTYSDSHDTVIDKSVNQSIWNEGTLNQRFTDNSVTATDHSVAAGRNINGDVANGDGNIVGDNASVGNTSNDYSTHGSFNGNNIADRGGIAGDGNVTDSDHSDVATNGSRLVDNREDSHDTTLNNVGNTTDSNNTELENVGNHNEPHTTTISDSGNYEPHTNYHPEITEDSNNTSVDDSRISHNEQNGLLNVNETHVLDDLHLHL